MKHRLFRLAILLFAVSFLLPLNSLAVPAKVQAKNVILHIGDGMGPEQARAGRYYLGRELSFESFPNRASVRTDNAYDEVTDSAAAATAMATGVKVANGVLSVALPGGGEEGHVPDLGLMLRESYQAAGWDLTTGRPLPETLRQLGIEAR